MHQASFITNWIGDQLCLLHPKYSAHHSTKAYTAHIEATSTTYSSGDRRACANIRIGHLLHKATTPSWIKKQPILYQKETQRIRQNEAKEQHDPRKEEDKAKNELSEAEVRNLPDKERLQAMIIKMLKEVRRMNKHNDNLEFSNRIRKCINKSNIAKEYNNLNKKYPGRNQEQIR